MKRIFLIVLDSCGIGQMPDAAAFGDENVNTLRSCAASEDLHIPNLIASGIGNIDGVTYLPKTDVPAGALGYDAPSNIGIMLLGSLPKRCLGLAEEGETDVLNLKCDPIMTFSLIDQKRIFRAYHMNKEHWISVRLDSDIAMDELVFLLDVSYDLVDKQKKRQAKESNNK